MMGYNSKYLIVNFGTLCWLFLVTPTCWLAATLLVRYNKTTFGWIGDVWNRRMFHNDWLGLFTDTYLFLGICVALNFNYFSFNSYGNVLNSVLSVIFAIILTSLPIFVGLFYRKLIKLD